MMQEQLLTSLVEQIADSLAKKEMEANPEVWHALLRVCAKAGDVKSSIRVLDIMRKHASSLVSTKSYVTIIDSLAKSSHIAKVIWRLRGHDYEISTDSYLWTSTERRSDSRYARTQYKA